MGIARDGIIINKLFYASVALIVIILIIGSVHATIPPLPQEIQPTAVLPLGGQIYVFGLSTNVTPSCSTGFPLGSVASVSGGGGVSTLALTANSSDIPCLFSSSEYNVVGVPVYGYSSYNLTYNSTSSSQVHTISDTFTIKEPDTLTLVYAIVPGGVACVPPISRSAYDSWKYPLVSPIMNKSDGGVYLNGTGLMSTVSVFPYVNITPGTYTIFDNTSAPWQCFRPNGNNYSSVPESKLLSVVVFNPGTINKPAISTECSPNPATPGENVTCTVDVTGNDTNGPVRFSSPDGGSFSETTATLSNGKAETLYHPISSPYTVTASYSGNLNNAATSNTFVGTLNIPPELVNGTYFTYAGTSNTVIVYHNITRAQLSAIMANFSVIGLDQYYKYNASFTNGTATLRQNKPINVRFLISDVNISKGLINVTETYNGNSSEFLLPIPYQLYGDFSFTFFVNSTELAQLNNGVLAGDISRLNNTRYVATNQIFVTPIGAFNTDHATAHEYDVFAINGTVLENTSGWFSLWVERNTGIVVGYNGTLSEDFGQESINVIENYKLTSTNFDINRLTTNSNSTSSIPGSNSGVSNSGGSNPNISHSNSTSPQQQVSSPASSDLIIAIVIIAVVIGGIGAYLLMKKKR